jgi:hypothetical protein
MATRYYVNGEDEPIWCITAMTKGGAWVLAKQYVKMGSKLVEEPMERDDSVWVVMVTNPFLDAASSS